MKRAFSAVIGLVMIAVPMAMTMQSRSPDVEARARALAGEDDGPAIPDEPKAPAVKPSIGKAAPLITPIPKLPVIEPEAAPEPETPKTPEAPPAPAAEPDLVETTVREPYQEKVCHTDAYGNVVSCEMVTKYRIVRRMLPRAAARAAMPRTITMTAAPCGNPNCTNPECPCPDPCNCGPVDSVSQVYAYAATPVYSEEQVAVYRAAPVRTYMANHAPVRTTARVAGRVAVGTGRVAVRAVTLPFRAVRGIRAARCANCE